MREIPDFGTALVDLGMNEACELHFNDFLVCNCGTRYGKTFSCIANAVLEVKPHAATFDLNRAMLDKLIMACLPEVAMRITDALHQQSANGWVIQFNEPMMVEIAGRLGEKQCARNGAVFIPLIATSVTVKGPYEPLSAALALVAIGREGEPVFEGISEDDEELKQLRDRVVEIGWLLDQQGGIDLMREVYTGAVRYLSEESIGIGRWVESVWDGIGNWQG